MTGHDEAMTGSRGSRDGWLEAGYRALIEGGVDAVKIQPLARQLNLSRTSFYWFFKDREALLSALRGLWDERTTRPLIAATLQYAETEAEAMFNVIGCFVAEDFDSRLEFAVRSWALQSPAVAEQMKIADTGRLTALADLLIRWSHDPEDADVRARTIYLVQMGYISMQIHEDTPIRVDRVPTYVKIYTGITPDERDITRFRNRFFPGT